MTDAIAENTQALNERVAEIDSNPDLSDTAKKRMAREAQDEYTKRHQELVRERREAQAQEEAQAERDVFSLRFPDSVITERDRQAYRDSYRDAFFRVRNLEDGELEEVLDGAEYTGDTPLAQAVYHRSVRRGVFPVANRYRETHPNAKQRWERHVDARQATEDPTRMLFEGFKRQGPTTLES
jgi:hypothetical protein